MVNSTKIKNHKKEPKKTLGNTTNNKNSLFLNITTNVNVRIIKVYEKHKLLNYAIFTIMEKPEESKKEPKAAA